MSGRLFFCITRKVVTRNFCYQDFTLKMAENAGCRTWLDGNHTAVTLIPVRIRFNILAAS